MKRMTNEQITDLSEQITKASVFLERITSEVQKVVVGQPQMINRLLTGLLCNGHVLLEGVPGLAKTLVIKTIAQAIQAKFSRIQFTPDLLPADVTGTLIYQPQTHQFVVRKGPVFAHFVLADEINRAPAKVQSALLEAMQERQVTIGEQTYLLEEPFLVLATQNPIDQEGTYPLPEAQVDRFMMKVLIDYPTREEERMILRQQVEGAFPAVSVEPVATIDDILQARKLVRKIYMDEKIEGYILDLVFATRKPSAFGLEALSPLIAYGGSPRATIHMALAARAQAFMQKRGYVIPEDVRTIARDVLRHRIGLTYEAAAENVDAEKVIGELLKTIRTP